MKKKDDADWKEDINWGHVSVLLCGIILMVMTAMYVLHDFSVQKKCCNGEKCDDVYYSVETNLCRYKEKKCDSLRILDKDYPCVWQGTNVSENLSAYELLAKVH